MKSDYLLIGSILSMATGLSLIIGYAQGTGGLNVAVPVSGTSLQISLKTTGWPVMIGFPLTLLGLLLLIAAFISAIARRIPGNTQP